MARRRRRIVDPLLLVRARQLLGRVRAILRQRAARELQLVEHHLDHVAAGLFGDGLEPRDGPALRQLRDALDPTDRHRLLLARAHAPLAVDRVLPDPALAGRPLRHRRRRRLQLRQQLHPHLVLPPPRRRLGYRRRRLLPRRHHPAHPHEPPHPPDRLPLDRPHPRLHRLALLRPRLLHRQVPPPAAPETLPLRRARQAVPGPPLRAPGDRLLFRLLGLVPPFQLPEYRGREGGR